MKKHRFPTAARAAAALSFVPLLFGGCASYVTTDVTAFSNWTGRDADKTYAFRRAPEQQHNLEQHTYEGYVADELSIYGFRQVGDAQAHYLVALQYANRDKTVVVQQPVYYDPWPGPFGSRGPWWGPPPWPAGYVSQTVPLFIHELTIRMTDRATGDEVYRVTATNASGDASLLPAMPYLARSALADFPLGNGTTRQVRLPYDAHAGAAAAPSNERPVGAPAR